VRLDPSVSRNKFQKELSRLRSQSATLQSRGIFIVGETVYPSIDFLFVPRQALGVAVQVPRTALGIILPQSQVQAVEIPSLAGRAFVAHFDLSDYDLAPPSIEFRDPWTKAVLDFPTMFRALEYEKQRGAHQVLLGDHPTTHKPFLCLRGVREYHDHPQHSGDDWLLYRGQMSLFSIVMSLWRTAIDLVRPVLVPQANALLVNWVAEEKR
jgi:hypothetical protein